MSKSLFQKYATNEERNLGYESAIVSTNYPYTKRITKKHNQITTVPAPILGIPAGVTLDVTGVGYEFFISNEAGGNNLNVNSSSGATLGLIPNSSNGWFRCVALNKWKVIITANVNQ